MPGITIGNETWDYDLDKLDSDGEFGGGLMDPFHVLSKDWKKFVGLTYDLHDIRNSLNDIRLCFIAITVSTYVGVLIYTCFLCCQRRRRRREKRRRAAARDSYAAADSDTDKMETTGDSWQQLHTVKSDGYGPVRYNANSINKRSNHHNHHSQQHDFNSQSQRNTAVAVAPETRNHVGAPYRTVEYNINPDNDQQQQHRKTTSASLQMLTVETNVGPPITKPNSIALVDCSSANKIQIEATP